MSVVRGEWLSMAWCWTRLIQGRRYGLCGVRYDDWNFKVGCLEKNMALVLESELIDVTGRERI